MVGKPLDGEPRSENVGPLRGLSTWRNDKSQIQDVPSPPRVESGNLYLTIGAFGLQTENVEWPLLSARDLV